MADDFVFEGDEPIAVGSPVENDFVYVRDELVSDGDVSDFAFIRDRGLGSAAGIVDDFEDGDVAEYEDVEGPGNGEFVTVTGTVYEGDYAARFESYDGSTSTIESLSGLNYYPSWGDDLTLHHYPDTNNSRAGAVMDSTDSGQERLRVRIFVDVDFGLDLPDGTSITDSSANIPTGEWCRAEVRTEDDGYAEAWLYDSDDNEISNVSGTTDTSDVPTTDLTWGFSQAVTGGGTSRSYWDYITAGPNLHG